MPRLRPAPTYRFRTRARRMVTVAALVLLATSCSRRAGPQIIHAWVRLPAVVGQPAAAYFVLRGGGHGTALVRIESALATRVELHESMTDMRGMSTMAPLPRVDLPAGAQVAFVPGGRHAMLFGLDPAATPGTAVPLRFGFSDGSTTEAEAKSVAAGADVPY